ncbi:zinc-dependent alcohol dehydrogenase family protein [Microbacterium thalassium]|uniref:alcohol dehydrogenase n=1 Tax=Microbacterium thalassium TaxID=362649 RepID=A0A7X0KVT9_9MICO|nr:zinc-dependent alcohol dehydrogenase family protein [Microbacterium thalassium]MBB6392419.1 propanol-preferring alcohol dehydrogenase [Microbacterium thalassium]GLK25048.1 alcohol dehydrogenase [Microbacterium thalassium]
MDAWTVDRGSRTLVRRSVPAPEPGPRDLLVRVRACGVCRTDLHVVDEDIAPHRDRVIPGHQIVGDVTATGEDVTGFAVGDVVGIAWLRATCGQCRHCRSGRENLCERATFTGWDADGGYAEYAVVDAAYAYALPPGADPLRIAPLLCAGIIGYRALTRANLPPGGTLGIYGFGSSAHIAAQLAMASGARVFAMTRGERNRELARELGAAFTGESHAVPPDLLDSAIVFAPAGELMTTALAATVRGGTVVSAGIHMSPIPEFSYDDLLFGERDLRSVTANTRADGDEFLRLAHRLDLAPEVTAYPFGEVDAALDDLRADRSRGSLVIAME